MHLLNGVGLAIVIDDVCVLDRSDMTPDVTPEAIEADAATDDACGADLLQGDCG